MDKNIWKSNEANLYNGFDISISDFPAYQVMYSILNPKNKVVLDFGCYHGKSSFNFITLGAKKVIGIDNFEKNIIKAKKNYFKNKNLDFLYVEDFKSIPINFKVDCVCLSFVHPTINDIKKLEFQFKKIFKVMKKNSFLVILGLHKNSFNEKFKFKLYKHKKIKKLIDGEPFQNELISKNKSFKFIDYWWSEKTIKGLLEKSEFSGVKFINLKKNSNEKECKILNKILENIDFDWEDEWVAPLYQLIIAKS